MSPVDFNPIHTLNTISAEDKAKIAGLGAAISNASESSEIAAKEEDGIAESIHSNNNTLLKHSLSVVGAGVNIVTRNLFGGGAELPIYEGTIAYNFNKRRSTSPDKTTRDTLRETSYTQITQDDSEDKIEKGPSINAFQYAARAIVNTPLVLANPFLFAITGSTFPTFEKQFPANLAKSASNKLNTLWNSKSIRPITKPIEVLHEKWSNLIKSKATYHTLTFGVTAFALISMGPAGWGIAAGATAFDVARGAARVNRIRNKSDKLNHLITLKKSHDTIKDLEKVHSQDFLKALGQPEKIKNIPSTEKNTEHKDELNKSALKGLRSAVIKESIPLGVAISRAVMSPAAATMEAIKEGMVALVSFAAATKGKLGEQQSKDIMDKDIASFQEHTKVGSSISKHDLAKTAYEHALYAKALEVAKTYKGDPSYTAERCKAYAEEILKKDPKFNELFSHEKMTAPPNIAVKSWRATKTAVSCTIDYLRPLKEATSYKKAYNEYYETHKPPENSNKSPSPINQITHSKDAERMQETFEKNGATTRRTYSGPNAIMNQELAHSRNTSQSLG